MEDENVSSVSVAVAQHGKIIWEESFGMANREKQIKATPNTMYEIASIAKVYTTTALMILQERGLLDIDAPVESYLGDVKIKSFGVDASGVTLRRIIQHTSGLPMLWGEPAGTDTNFPIMQKEIFDRFAILAFKPGERELYSNVGIGLLTYVIENVSGKSYSDFLKENIFLPLGLTYTIRLTTPPSTDEYAQQYDHSGKPWTYNEGFYASADDLLRFGMFHLKNHLPDQRKILSDSTIDVMQTSIDPYSDFRLPWWVWEYEGYKTLVFTGASGTILALLPEADLAIVVLANKMQANTPKVCKWIADEILDDFDESKRLPTKIRTHKKIQPPTLSRVALAGIWQGSIVTHEWELQVELSLGNTPMMRSQNVDGSWGRWMESMFTLRGNYSAGIFSAYFPIHIPVHDTKEHNHWTWIYVGLHRDTLRGYAVAHAADGPHYGLPYYINLERKKD
ncbi:MAG: beta-lactamase family protein [Ignavibacteriales bacterium]|nr:beta-lactamase family protein [Ignavibacteriales bacterium]